MSPEEKKQVDAMRDHLHKKAITKNLAQQHREERIKLTDGMKEWPVKKMMDDVQYMLETMLPKISASRGEDSLEYKFYNRLTDHVLWSIIIVERYEEILKSYARLQHRNALTERELVMVRQEISKYQMAEDLLFTEGYSVYLSAAAEKAYDKLKEKK